MSCETTITMMSEAFDGTLDEASRARFDAHVGACGECAGEWESFQASTTALQSLRVRPLRTTTVASIVAAAYDDEGAEAAPVTGAPSRGRWIPWITHVAALVIGLVLARTSMGEPAPEIVEREVRVEVPREVEVPVEVPVETIVEVPVETIVHVPVEVPVSTARVVEKPNDLQPSVDRALDIARSIASVARDGASVARTAFARSGGGHADGLSLTPVPSDSLADAGPVAAPTEPKPVRRAPARGMESVRVVRDGSRVAIHTRGTMEDVIPGLIAALDHPDDEVVRAAQAHLQRLRDRIEPTDRGTRSIRAEAPSGGIRELLRERDQKNAATVAATSPRDEWSEWWESQGGATVAVATY